MTSVRSRAPRSRTSEGNQFFARVRQVWRKLYDLGLCDNAIAQRLGTSPRLIGVIRAEAGLPIHRQSARCACGRSIIKRNETQCCNCRIKPLTSRSSLRYQADPAGWLTHLDRLAARAQAGLPLFEEANAGLFDALPAGSPQSGEEDA